PSLPRVLRGGGADPAGGEGAVSEVRHHDRAGRPRHAGGREARRRQEVDREQRHRGSGRQGELVKMKRKRMWLWLAAVAVLAPAVAAAAAGASKMTLPPAVVAAAKAQITRGALEGPIRFLADDALEGRGPATRGDTLARRYLASELQAMGYEPGALDGAWEQPFDVVGVTAHAPPLWTFRRAAGTGGTVDLKWSDDYVVGSGVQTERASIKDAEVVFAGYGIEAPEYGWDDFKGADVRGKVLMMLNNDPDWDPKLFAGKTRLYYGRWTYKFESAARHGAAAVVIIHTTPSAGYPWQVVQSSWSGEQFELPAEGEPRIQLRAWATEEAARRLFKAGGQDLDKLVA